MVVALVNYPDITGLPEANENIVLIPLFYTFETMANSRKRYMNWIQSEEGNVEGSFLVSEVGCLLASVTKRAQFSVKRGELAENTEETQILEVEGQFIKSDIRLMLFKFSFSIVVSYQGNQKNHLV